MTIKLGCFDSDISEQTCQSYIQQIGQMTRVPLTQVTPGLDKLTLQKYAAVAPAMCVAEVQEGLQAIGFFPNSKVDGIYGYRTQSAIRLFQEYLRSVEKIEEVVPDGQFGAATQGHLQRWLAGKLKSQWTQAMESFQAGTLGQSEYADWLALLEKVKQQYLATPNKMLQKVNAYAGASGTRKVAAWDFKSPANVHLIGIRSVGFRGKFEDIFILLLNGLVFKFQGSTDPGAAADSAGYPFLVQGQHDYHFGWHKETYLALRPLSQVLVLRSKTDELTEADLNNRLEANASINVHWGGPGMAKDVHNWSEGCQVINGTVYINPANELISCSKFAAYTSQQPLSDPTKTRGAYNVLLDLITTFGLGQGATLSYMMLVESDLDLDPTLKQGLADARNKVLALL